MEDINTTKGKTDNNENNEIESSVNLDDNNEENIIVRLMGVGLLEFLQSNSIFQLLTLSNSVNQFTGMFHQLLLIGYC